MRLGIKHKIFTILVLSFVVLALSMTLFSRWSLQRGFLTYINSVEQQVLTNVTALVQQRYQHDGGWQLLATNPQLWRRLLHRARSDTDPLLPGNTANNPFNMRERRPRRFVGGLNSRLQLLDSDHRFIVGVPVLHQPELQPLYAQGRVVGYLAHSPPRVVRDLRRRAFVSTQNRSFLLIAILAVGFAALIAWPLARHLVRRIQALAVGTHRLAAGDFTTRIAVDSDDELGRLAGDFNLLAATLEKNEQLRRDWVADISHELRTPLTVLRGELEAVQDGVRPLNRHTVDNLHAEVMQLGRLVDDLYQLSMSDAGTLSYRKTELNAQATVTAAIELFRPRFADRDITISLRRVNEITAPLFADPERLQQLLDNVLENSLSYTDSGGSVEIELARHDHMLQLRICDSAPGVESRELQRLFERLYRAESSRNRASGGRGLGLSICHNIVIAHGGTITAQPSPLGGVCIVVQLPLQQG